MPSLQIPTVRIEDFHSWLADSGSSNLDHSGLLEAWLYATDSTRVRGQMGLARADDKIQFILDLPKVTHTNYRSRVQQLAEAVSRRTQSSRTKGEDDEEGESGKRDIPHALRSEIKGRLEPVLLELYADYLKERPLTKEEAAARMAGEAKKLQLARIKVGEQRRRQIDIFGKAAAGTFWACAQAVDGKPMLLFSSSPTTRPSPNLISLCLGEGDDQPDEQRGSWKRVGTTLHLEVSSGTAQIALAAAQALGLTATTEPAPAKVVDPRLIERLRTNQRSHTAIQATGKGWFWWVPAGLLPAEPVLLLSGAHQPDYDRLCAGQPNLSGEFRWDRTDRRAHLRLKRDPGGGAALSRGLVAHLKAKRLFDGHPVSLLAPKASFPSEGADDKAMQAFLAQITTHNRSCAAGKQKAYFWFAASTANKTPALVLYEAPPLPPRVWTLLDDDPGAKNLASEGTWEKDLKGKRVLFTFPGANGKPGLQRPLTVLLAKLSLFPGFKVEVVR
jgi:hypothetical protein